MTPVEIITMIFALLSTVISSGAFIALFQIRTLNAKNLADAGKTKAEARNIEAEEKNNIFKSQIDAANSLCSTMSKRIDQLTKEIEDYHIKDTASELEIGKLNRTISQDSLVIDQLKRKINITSRLLDRLLNILRSYLAYRSQILDLGQDEDVNKIKDIQLVLDEIEHQYNDLQRENSGETQKFK